MKITIVLHAAKKVQKNYTLNVYREDSEEDISEEYGKNGTYHWEYDEYLTQEEIQEIHDFVYGIDILKICNEE